MTASLLGAVASLTKSQEFRIKVRADPSQTQPRVRLSWEVHSKGLASGPDRGKSRTVPRRAVAQLLHQW